MKHETYNTFTSFLFILYFDLTVKETFTYVRASLHGYLICSWMLFIILNHVIELIKENGIIILVR